MATLVLASASARRRAFLQALRIPFEAIPAEVQEVQQENEPASSCALRLAREKAAAVAARAPGRWVLAADTVVAVNEGDATGERATEIILGKPRDRADARRMLRLLSGRAHYVHTGVVLRSPDGGLLLDEVVCTRVEFRPLQAEEIDTYVGSGEADDKAGAYGIQERGGSLVARFQGSYTNVVGLPMEVVETALRHAGFLVEATSTSR